MSSVPVPLYRLSNELQAGKAAEHLVCADLILQGYSAFLADQGLPYDVIVDTGNTIKRVQVKATVPKTVQGRLVYPFGTRRSKGTNRPVGINEVDYYAFVALDVRLVAYLPVAALASRNGVSVVQTIHFRARHLGASARPHHPIGHGKAMRHFEDFAELPVM